jgi:hypothetical protein
VFDSGGGGLGIFLFSTMSRPVLRPTQPPIQWVQGFLSLGVKRPVREADHSSPSSTEVKNAWSYTSTPQYVFMARCLVKHSENFTVTCTGHKVTYVMKIHITESNRLFDSPSSYTEFYDTK